MRAVRGAVPDQATRACVLSIRALFCPKSSYYVCDAASAVKFFSINVSFRGDVR